LPPGAQQLTRIMTRTCANGFAALVVKLMTPPSSTRLFLGGSPPAFTRAINALVVGPVTLHQPLAAAGADGHVVFSRRQIDANGRSLMAFVALSCTTADARRYLGGWLTSPHDQLSEW
jgi:hypothetical protein